MSEIAWLPDHSREPDLKHDGPEIQHMTRAELLEHEWPDTYEPGQHVTFIGPTQRGKTHLSLQLLDKTITPDHQAVILSGKPPSRDATMNHAAKQLHLRTVSSFPPAAPTLDRMRKFRGYVLRPVTKLSDNAKADDAKLTTEFGNALTHAYRTANDKHPIITVADEAHLIQNDLKLKSEYERPLMRGAPHNAVWSLIQRGRFMSYHAYSAPEHVFIFRDDDRSNQERYSEIGGIDRRTMTAITRQLKTFRTASGRTISECVYFRRSEPERLRIIGVQ